MFARRLVYHAALWLCVVGTTQGARRSIGETLGNDLIEFGFEPDEEGDQPYLVRETLPLFEFSQKDVSERKANMGKVKIFASDNARTASDKFSASLSIDATYGAFSAAASASTNSESESSYQKMSIVHLGLATKFKVSIRALYPYKHLRPDVKELLLNGSPANIMKKLGCFYAKEMTLGATKQNKFEQIKTSEDSLEEFEAEFTASGGWGILSASATASAKTVQKKSSSGETIKIKIQTRGGDASKLLKVNRKGDNQEEVMQEWAETIENDNLVPTSYKLVPLWELLEHKDMSPAKARELKEHMLSVWKKNGLNLPTLKIRTRYKKEQVQVDGVFGSQTTFLLQKFLNRRGFVKGYDLDGIFGPKTKKSLQRFLKSKGTYTWHIDGDFGKTSTKALQKWLNNEGFSVYVDGDWGKQTTKALQRFLNSDEAYK